MYRVRVTQEAFGSRLRVEREKRGLTLKAISDSTKIKQSLFAGLERGDVSKWPGGLFRRAYLREYASAVGLPTEPLVEEFVRLFPEETDWVPPSDHPPPTEIQTARRTPPALGRRETAGHADRVRTALFDIGFVAVLSAGLALTIDLGLLPVLGVLAPGYLVLTTACLGQSGGSWLFSRKNDAPATPRLVPVTVPVSVTAPRTPAGVDSAAEPPYERLGHTELRLQLAERPRRAS